MERNVPFYFGSYIVCNMLRLQALLNSLLCLLSGVINKFIILHHIFAIHSIIILYNTTYIANFAPSSEFLGFTSPEDQEPSAEGTIIE